MRGTGNQLSMFFGQKTALSSMSLTECLGGGAGGLSSVYKGLSHNCELLAVSGQTEASRLLEAAHNGPKLSWLVRLQLSTLPLSLPGGPGGQVNADGVSTAPKSLLERWKGRQGTWYFVTATTSTLLRSSFT